MNKAKIKQTTKVAYVHERTCEYVKNDDGEIVEMITTVFKNKSQETEINRLSEYVAQYQVFHEKVYNQYRFWNFSQIGDILKRYDLFGRHD
jgi:hypothetical protein